MSEHQAILAQTVDRLFRRIKDSETSGSATSEQLWQSIEELGIADIFLPEDLGGMNGSWQDASIVFRLSGYHAIALPIGETIVARKIMYEHGLEAIPGPVALSQSGNGHLTQDSESFSGTVTTQTATIPSSNLLVSLQDRSEFHFVLLNPANAIAVIEKTNVANEPRYTYVFEQAKCSAVATAATALHYGALLRTCQSAGALSATLEMCVQFTHDRVQFGRPLKKFQAIQHQLALLVEEAAAVASASDAAAFACDHGNANFEIACAKLRSNQSVTLATSIAHQVHGAIGFTKEYKLYHYTQRLWAWRSEFGNDRHWAHYLGKYMLQLQGQSPWQYLTSRGEQ